MTAKGVEPAKKPKGRSKKQEKHDSKSPAVVTEEMRVAWKKEKNRLHHWRTKLKKCVWENPDPNTINPNFTRILERAFDEGFTPDDLLKILLLPKHYKDQIVKVKETMEKRIKGEITSTDSEGDILQFDKAMLRWLEEQMDDDDINATDLTLYNILERAEELATKILVESKSHFKVSESWFKEFRKKYRLEIKYAEELEIIEARKRAFNMRNKNKKPDFVWGECDGCDKTDCPVHEWSAVKRVPKTKPAPQTPLLKKVQDNWNRLQKGVIEIGEQSLQNQTSAPSKLIAAATSDAGLDAIKASEIPLTPIVEVEPNVQNLNANYTEEEQINFTDSESDSSNFVIDEDSGEMDVDETIVKTEDTIVTCDNVIINSQTLQNDEFSENIEPDKTSKQTIKDFTMNTRTCVNDTDESASADYNNHKNSAENCVKNRKRKADVVISLDSDSESSDNADTFKRAFEFFQKGLSIIETCDSSISRRQTFSSKLRELLKMYEK